MKRIVISLLLLTLLNSCGEYQKAMQSEDPAVKYEVGMKEYDKGDYTKAIVLFEQIAPSYRGKPQAEKMFFMYAQALYKTEQFYSAGYQFESFVSSYPGSEKVEEAAFLGAKSYSKLSPVYSLDQIDTYKAIEKLQTFINDYPTSTYAGEAGKILKSLTDKIERKAFEVAKQYNTISDYKAALVVFDNFLSDYPGSIYKEKALYFKFDSAYNLAVNSVSNLMEERLLNAQQAYESLVRFNPNTEYKPKADQMKAKIETELKQFSK